MLRGHRELERHGVLILYADDRIAECRQGRSPVKLVNANPSVAHLEGAAFEVGQQDSYKDASNRIHIQLLEKVGKSYRIRFQPLSAR